MMRAPFRYFPAYRHVAAICAAFLFVLVGLVGAANAAPVTIRSGGLELTGEVLGYDGTYLRLGTDMGEVTLDFRAASCTGDACPNPDDYVPTLRLPGPERLTSLLLPALIEGYARSNGLRALRRETGPDSFAYDLTPTDSDTPDLSFEFRVTSSDQAFVDLMENRADGALSEREIRPVEISAAQEAGLGRLTAAGRSRILALDALVPIVSPRRGLDRLSLPQLAGLLRGEITNWAQLGGADGPVRLHLPEAGSGFAQSLSDTLLGGTPPVAEVTRHADPVALADAVAADRDALGIVPFASAGIAQTVPLGGGCGMVSAADIVTLKTEDYPLTRPLFLYLPLRRLPPRAASWLAWLRTAEAQRIVRRAGFVDRGALPIPVAAQGDRLARAIEIIGEDVTVADVKAMTAKLVTHERLSTTFRFEPGSTRLDAQSRSNMLHFARRLRDGDFDGQHLSLAGFSDGAGPAAANLTLSRARAETVKRALREALGGRFPDGITLEIDAFGESLPLACDDSRWGRQSNRRVELWVGK